MTKIIPYKNWQTHGKDIERIYTSAFGVCDKFAPELEKQHQGNNIALLVEYEVESQRRLSGWILARVENADEASRLFIAVEPDAQLCGLSRILYQGLEHKCKQHNIKRLTGMANQRTSLPVLQRIYKKKLQLGPTHIDENSGIIYQDTTIILDS
jgi:GNAT superfamily N-acetyltransferase